MGLDIKNYFICCIGFNPDTPRPVDNKGYQVTQAIVQHMELGTFAAQYILHTFLARLAHSIDEVTTPTVVRDEQATGPLLRNDTITDLALKVQERGLCTIAEAYRMVLCAFTAAGKLPVPYRQSADPFLVLYQKALELGHKFKGKNDKTSPAALRAEKIYEEALSLCRYKALGLINDNRWVDAGALVVRAARISENFSTKEGEHMKEMRDLMLLVGSKFVSNSPVEATSVNATENTSPRAPRAPSPMLSPADLSLEPISASSKLITAYRFVYG
ncbi:hypothetical protein BGX38DRAFT_1264167 [Terfezia claveryi]|nr:hypothetical protein BGX38DRAFT_1264167 [Terfezia claveryi]